MHSDHPDSHTHGLADGCERCSEHASHPFASLDQTNLRVLMERIVSGLRPRSDNERVAMLAVRDVLNHAGGLARTDPELLCEFIHVKWGVELTPTELMMEGAR